MRAGLREEQNLVRATQGPAHQDERKGRVVESLFLRLLGTLEASFWHRLWRISKDRDVERTRPMSMTSWNIVLDNRIIHAPILLRRNTSEVDR